MQPKHKTLIFILILSQSTLFSQTLYQLQAAIDTALLHNLGLMIDRNDAQIATNNASKGNAGMLPRVDFNAGTSVSDNFLNQKFSTGTEIKRNGVFSRNLNGQILMNWTLYDGKKMFVTLEKLQLLKKMSETDIQLKTEEIVFSVTNAYNDIVRQKLIERGLKKNVNVYEERVKMADARLKLGKSAKTELLQAEIDYNLQKNNLLRQQTLLKNAKNKLKILLFLPYEKEIEVADTLLLAPAAILSDLLNRLENGNKQLFQLRMTEQQRLLEIREQEAQLLPKVNLNAGYNFTNTASSSGLFLKNQSTGPLLGLTVNWNIYDGKVLKTQIENSKIRAKNATLAYKETTQNLQNNIINAWQRLQDTLELIKIEQATYKIAEEYLYIMTQRFRLNEATILELKDAQQSNETSLLRLVNTQYEAKTAETELKYLIGNLY